MKKKINYFFSQFYDYLIHNKQFVSYVFLSIILGVLLRLKTSGNFGYNPLLFDIAMPILIGSFAFLIKPKKQFIYLFICLLLLSLVCIINTIYYEFYSSYASFSLLASLGQVGEVEDALFEKIKIGQFIYLLGPIIFMIINKKLNNIDYFNYVSKFENSKKLFKKTIISGISLTIFASILLNGGAWSCLFKEWNREYIVNDFGITVYQINDLFNTLKPTIGSWIGYDVAYKKFDDYYANNKLPKSNNKYTNEYKDYNIIFIHMESITSFLIDLKVNDTIITPNLNKISKEGMYFTNFYPQVSVGTSSDTEFTLSTSLMPAASGTVFVSYFDREYPTIYKLLKDKGYYTFSMHANKASMWNRAKMHPNLGYTDFYSQTSFELDELVGLGLSDKSFFRQAMPILENIEKNNKKYVGTIITLSNHTPFDNNELFDQIDLTYNKGEYDYLEGTKLGDYIRSAHYADAALGEFFKYVNESDFFNNTLFVLYGDHDPKLSLKEFYNYYNFNPENGEIYNEEDEYYIPYDYYANELNKKTPLIIWTKNKEINEEINYNMGMIDVMPTIGNMVGVYNEYALGHDIFEVKKDNIIVFPNGNFLTNKIYYHNAKNEYKTLTTDEILREDYIEKNKAYVDNILDISDGIIRHNLIKASQNKDNIKEIK